MARSVAALLAVLILPSFLSAQQAPTHVVVGEDTLWDLAERFYGDPFDWRRIWEANRAEVEDPNLILPGQVLTIPAGGQAVADAGGDRASVEVSVEDAAEVARRTSPDGRERTVFYRDPSDLTGVVRTEEAEYVPVPRHVAWSAPWLVGLEEVPEHRGVLERFAGGSQRSETPRSYDRVLLEMQGSPPPVGAVLRTYHVTRLIEGVGRVVTPTGLVTVTDVTDDGVVAMVTQEYDRIELGDWVGELPEYGLVEGRYAQPAGRAEHAMIVGFAGFNEVHDIGSVAFLDLGADQGIALGDEFEYLNPLAGSDVVEGRLQVVGVRSGVASARILEMDDAVFEQGVVVRLARTMP